MYRLTTKSLDRITKQERARLNLLTLKNGGGWVSLMREEILRRKKALHRIQLFLIRNDYNMIVAWCSIRPHRKDGLIYTYVMQSQRKKGLGTRLFNRAVAWCTKHGYTPRILRSTDNAKFFDKVAPQETKVDIAGY